MILIFDLDDTLYPEDTYVASGFWAVSAWLQDRFGWDPSESLSYMIRVCERDARGCVFDRLLERHGACSKALIRECLRVYRHHEPAITLFPAAADLLESSDGPLYLVTDGHKVVQQKKVRALGIETQLKKVFLTHRYGVQNTKPSTHCFEIIRKMERCAWREMAYIGDNPAKDFVNLTPLGVLTVRVTTGMHRHEAARSGYEAAHVIDGLDELPNLLSMLSR